MVPVEEVVLPVVDDVVARRVVSLELPLELEPLVCATASAAAKHVAKKAAVKVDFCLRFER